MASKNGQDLDASVLKRIAAALMIGQDDGLVRKALVHTSDDLIITIPKTMDKLQAAKELKRQWEEEETRIDVARSFNGWKWQDTLVAVHITAEKYFGWIDVKQSFMNPPTEIQIITDYVNGLPVKRTCFYGEFKVEALDEAVCSIMPSGGIVHISFNIKKKFKKRIEDWFDLIDQHLRANSIYRGKSVSITSEGAQFNDPVNFEIIETRSNPKIVLNPKERSVIEQYCALDLREKGKRTYLFTGGYGNGKTEAAMMLGDQAKNLGMTFFYVKDSDAFVHLLEIAAKSYSPCLIFMEDIDEVGSGEERTQQINILLNTLDGAATKNKDIKVLFTTNHHNAINPALRRPGRLDLIVRFENPTNETRQEIFRRYFVALEVKKIAGEGTLDYPFISEATPDCSGAFVAEICKRAMRLAELNNGITNEICIAAINTIGDHLAMMNDPVEQGDKLRSAVKTLGAAMIEGSMEQTTVTKQDLAAVAQNVKGAVAASEMNTAKRLTGGFQKQELDTAKVKDDTTKIKKAVVEA